MIASERQSEALINFSKQFDNKFKYVPSLRSIWKVCENFILFYLNFFIIISLF